MSFIFKTNQLHLPYRAMPSGPTFTFGDPIQVDLQSLGKSYYLQHLSTENNAHNVLITSDWFRSEGIKSGCNNRAEMLFKTSGVVRHYLNAIEAAAVQQLKIPVNLLQEHGISNECPIPNLYRPLNQTENLYAKLERDCPIFDSRRQTIKKEDTGFGEYRVLLHVKGLYLGPHSSPGKLASLQMRISQIQYREVNVTCLLEPMAGLCRNQMQTMSAPSPIATSTPNKPPQVPAPNAPKKGRQRQKPALQRQNALSESQILTQALDNGSSDFFADMDV